MAKKKNAQPIAYTPLSDYSQVTAEIENKIAQIPAYEDSGVRYQGKYKTQTSGNSYELKGQGKILTTGKFSSTNSADNYALSSQKKFFMTGLWIQWALAAAVPAQKLYLADYDTDLASYKITKGFEFFCGIQASGSIFFDFSSAPIEFSNRMAWGLGVFPGLAATDYINYGVIGFEEQS